MEKIYICQVCGKAFGTNKKLTGHLSCHNDGGECSYCGKEFQNGSALHLHEKQCENNENRIFLEKPKTECEFCGKLISNNNLQKHLDRHNKYPGMDFNKPYHQLDHDDLFCKYCHKECKNKNSLLNHEIRCKNNLDKIEVYKENFNEFGHEAWNKGLTKDTDDRVRKNGESLHQSYVTGKCTPLTGDLNPSSKQEVKDKISNACLTKSANGEWHTLKLRKQEYNGVIFDSSWEVAYAKYLDNNNIKWVRCTEKFKYIYDEKIRNYTPDFYLPETDEYVEIKGYEFNPEVNNAKFNYFPKKLIVLREQQLKELNIIT